MRERARRGRDSRFYFHLIEGDKPLPASAQTIAA